MTQRHKPGNIRDVLLVGSGKGGVGKTTVSVNLALALSRTGRRVALLDADLYGPNVPLMLGITRTRPATGWQEFVPIITTSRDRATPRFASVERFGLRVMSAGFLMGDSQAAQIGSSVMVGKIMESLLYLVDWGDSDTILIDLPPGSDEPVATIVQTTDLAGAIVVTTPQDVARLDARREIERLKRAAVPLLGIVENMSYFVCGHCGERQEVFRRGDRYADLGAPVLGQVPLDPQIGNLVDEGRPPALVDSAGDAGSAFVEIAEALTRLL